MPDFKLPDLGEGVTEAEIDRWLVQEGDVIEEDAPLVEVITDKANAEIPSPFAGTIARIHVQPGDVVPVGTVLVTVNGDDGAEQSLDAPYRHGPPPPPPQVHPLEEAREQLRRLETQAAGTGNGSKGAEGIKAMPPVRRLARSLGVDLGTVTGSGPDGRILRSDIEAAAGSSTATAALGAQRSGERVPYRGVRRKIGERLTHAHLVVPPVTHVEECDVTELDATRKLANERSPGGPRLTYLPFIVKSVVAALKSYPALNASLDEEAGEIVMHDRYDIGVAIDAPAGLTVGVVRAADTLRLRAIAAEIDRLAIAAREGELAPEDLRDPTFTISSPGGRYGGLMATPIVFHPQSAILGVHRAVERPVARDGQIVIRKMMNLSITFDHRIMDGMTAARFVLDVIKLLEHPAVLALES